MKTLFICTLLTIFSLTTEARYFKKPKLGGTWTNQVWMRPHHHKGFAHHSSTKGEKYKLTATVEKIRGEVASIMQAYIVGMKVKIASFTEEDPLAPVKYCNNQQPSKTIDSNGDATALYQQRLGFTAQSDQIMALTNVIWDKSTDINPAAKGTDGIFGNLVDEEDSSADVHVDNEQSLCGMNNCDQNSVIGNLANHIRAQGYHVRHDDICQGKFFGSDDLQTHPQCNLQPQEGKASFACLNKCKDVNFDENYLGDTCFNAAEEKNIYTQSDLETSCRENCKGVPQDSFITPGEISCPVYCDYNIEKDRWEPDFVSKGTRLFNVVEGCNLGVSDSDCFATEAPTCHSGFQMRFDRTLGRFVDNTASGSNPSQNCGNHYSEDSNNNFEIIFENSELSLANYSTNNTVTYGDNAGELWSHATLCQVYNPRNDTEYPGDLDEAHKFDSAVLYEVALDNYNIKIRELRKAERDSCLAKTNADGQSGKWEEFYSEFVKPNMGSGPLQNKGGENGLANVCDYIEDLSIPESQYVCEKSDPDLTSCTMDALDSTCTFDANGNPTGTAGDGDAPCTCESRGHFDQINVACSRNITVDTNDGPKEVATECFCAEWCPLQSYHAAGQICKTFFAPKAIVRNRRDEMSRKVAYSVANPADFNAQAGFPETVFVTGAFNSNIDEKGINHATGVVCDTPSAGCSANNDFCLGDAIGDPGRVYNQTSDPSDFTYHQISQHDCKKTSRCQTFRSIVLAINGNAQLNYLREAESTGSRAWWDTTIEETRADLSRIAAFATNLAGFSSMVPHIGGDAGVTNDLVDIGTYIEQNCGAFVQWESGQRGEMNAGMCGPESMDYETWKTPKTNKDDKNYYSAIKSQNTRSNCLCRGRDSATGAGAKGFGDTAFLGTNEASCKLAISKQTDADGTVEHASTERFCGQNIGDYGTWQSALKKLLPSKSTFSSTIPDANKTALLGLIEESIGDLDKELVEHLYQEGNTVGKAYSRNRRDCGRITNAIMGLDFDNSQTTLVTKSNIGGNCIPLKNLDKVLYHLEYELMADIRTAEDYDGIVVEADGGTGKPTFNSRMCSSGGEGDLSYRQVAYDWKVARCGSICSTGDNALNLKAPEPESDPTNAQFTVDLTDSYAQMCYIDLNQLMSGGEPIVIGSSDGEPNELTGLISHGHVLPDPLDYREDEVNEAAKQAILAKNNAKVIPKERDMLFQTIDAQFSKNGATLAVFVGEKAGEHWIRVMEHIAKREHHDNSLPTNELTDLEQYGADEGGRDTDDPYYIRPIN